LLVPFIRAFLLLGSFTGAVAALLTGNLRQPTPQPKSRAPFHYRPKIKGVAPLRHRQEALRNQLQFCVISNRFRLRGLLVKQGSGWCPSDYSCAAGNLLN